MILAGAGRGTMRSMVEGARGPRGTRRTTRSTGALGVPLPLQGRN